MVFGSKYFRQEGLQARGAGSLHVVKVAVTDAYIVHPVMHLLSNSAFATAIRAVVKLHVIVVPFLPNLTIPVALQAL
jgi:hypothetical protein